VFSRAAGKGEPRAGAISVPPPFPSPKPSGWALLVSTEPLCSRGFKPTLGEGTGISTIY